MNSTTLPAETPTKVIELQAWLVNQLAEQFDLDAESIDIQKPLTQYGLDSIVAFTVVGELEEYLDIELPATLLWEHETIERAAEYVVNEELAEVNS